MDAVFHFEMWDHDTIGSDDFIGEATFTLRDVSMKHVPFTGIPPFEPLQLKLLDKKGNGDRYNFLHKQIINNNIILFSRNMCPIPLTLCPFILFKDMTYSS